MMFKRISKDKFNGQYIFGETLNTLGAGTAVQIPQEVNQCSLAIIIEGTGVGKVQYTLDSTAELTLDTALWLDWPLGEVSVSTTDGILTPVTAVRGYCISGEVHFRVVG